MPHVDIKCFPGRTDDQKKRCAQKVAEDISEILGCDISRVSVTIKDIEKADWKEKVWDSAIIKDKDFLYKEPGYTLDD